MNAPQLLCGALALAVAVSGCHRPTKAEVKQTASDAAATLKVESANARDQLADVWLSTKIHSKFVADRDIKASDLSVSSKDGVVTLKGQVLNQPMRDLAVAIAKNTDGVTQVVDRLSVQTAGPFAPARAQHSATPGAVATTGTIDSTAGVTRGSDDLRITSNIQSKYFLDDRIKGRHINVTSDAGVVTLNGVVGDETERAEALLLARTTEGVRRVEDSLTVTAAPDGDASLTARVKSQLSSDTQITRAPIDVTAKSGVVLLQGTVTSSAAKQRALTLARGTDGVTQVVDRIRIAKSKK